MPSHINSQVFREKSIEKHGEKYDYSQSNYTKSSVKIDIICKKHGLFSQLPLCHMNGSGCKKCADELNTKKQKASPEPYYSGQTNPKVYTCVWNGDPSKLTTMNKGAKFSTTIPCEFYPGFKSE